MEGAGNGLAGSSGSAVEGTPGDDFIVGGAGNDRLRAGDGVRDSAVNCGEDTDEPTEKDSFDAAVNCE
jgi:Ca2+-binding RTX toxin-like protein